MVFLFIYSIQCLISAGQGSCMVMSPRAATTKPKFMIHLQCCQGISHHFPVEIALLIHFGSLRKINCLFDQFCIFGGLLGVYRFTPLQVQTKPDHQWHLHESAIFILCQVASGPVGMDGEVLIGHAVPGCRVGETDLVKVGNLDISGGLEFLYPKNSDQIPRIDTQTHRYIYMYKYTFALK